MRLKSDTKRWLKQIVIFLCLIFSFTSCRKAADLFTNPSPREKHARQFSDNDPRLHTWWSSFGNVLEDSLTITLPYRETGWFRGGRAYGYEFTAKRGQRLVIELICDDDSIPLFIDLYDDSGKSLMDESHITSLSASYDITSGGSYRIVLQPGISTYTRFRLRLYTQPSYMMPVAGATNRSVQSFWGADRDGGRRSHEGIDIFAVRGTPVVAAADGRISYTGEKGLGGKQVWQRESVFKSSLYYAHLDSISATSYQQVKAGDTIGFVGNTGNARTTAPHLHFGVYRSGRGAVDPYPFVRSRAVPVYISDSVSLRGRIKGEKLNVRISSSTASDIIGTLSPADTVTILGKTDDWSHVVARDSMRGFVYSNLLVPVPARPPL
ncbi:MAG: M23 family metallopeptidase [Cyclobacteriaceae bacterium]